MLKPFCNQNKVENRSCGTCSACCTSFSISELNKPANVDCPHIVDNNPSGCCGIYNDRPKSCSDFQCIWLQGWVGGSVHRPDKLGIMLTAIRHKDKQVIHIWEVREGAFGDDKVKRILRELASHVSIVLIDKNNKTGLLGTASSNKAFIEEHQ